MKTTEIAITTELIQRYNLPGPRYTSYPTVPVWNQGEFRDEYSAALGAEGKSRRDLSLYIHIPFCRQLCTFCGCNKFITRDQQLVERYLHALEQEIEAVARALTVRKRVAQLHLGGGTPTFLNMKQLNRVTDAVRGHFDINPRGEWAYEANPRVTTDEQLAGLYELGFRRVSFGVQDLDPEVQRAINRNQTPEQSRSTFETARRLGYESINLDLVYGLPIQNRGLYRKTLEEVSRLRPDRLAVYSFAHLPWMFKAHERALRREDLPSPEEKIGLYLDTIRHFTGDGYIMIGMDHYALPDDELTLAQQNRTLHRNFMGYTTLHGMAQIGLGVSAISDFGDSYWQNSKDLHEYLEHSAEPTPIRGMSLDQDDQLRRGIIETLMCHGEIPVAKLEAEHGMNFRSYFTDAWQKLEQYAGEGLVFLHEDRVELSAIGRLFMRNLAMPFDSYLDAEQKARYSQTV